MWFYWLSFFSWISCGSPLEWSLKDFCLKQGVSIIQFRSISGSFGSMYFFFKAQMLALQKIFLIVRFFNWIACNKGLKLKISCFSHVFFLFNPLPWDWNVLESERLLCSWHHLSWRNTKICILRASWMERKRGKCWKSPIFEGKLRVFVSYLSEMKTVSMFCNSSLF